MTRLQEKQVSAVINGRWLAALAHPPASKTSTNLTVPKTSSSSFPSPYRYVLQVQVLVVHGVAQLPDLLLHFGNFSGTELKVALHAGHAPTLLVQLQQPDHKLEARPVQVHVQTVSTENVHERRRAQSEVLLGTEDNSDNVDGLEDDARVVKKVQIKQRLRRKHTLLSRTAGSSWVFTGC